jgi:hypothetical protein
MPWRPYLLPFILLELLCKVVLLLLRDVVVEFGGRPRIAIVVVISVELGCLGSEGGRDCEAAILQLSRDRSRVLGESIYPSLVFWRVESGAWERG